MANEAHLYLVADGVYESGTDWLGVETWQYGIRLSFRLKADPDPIGTFPENEWDVVAANIDRTETSWKITSNWMIEGGVSDFDPGDYMNDQAGPAVKAYHQKTGLFSQSLILQRLRLWPIGAPNGKVIPAPPLLQGSPCTLQYTGSAVAGNVSGMMPPQISVVMSARTGQTGRRGRGRWFTPGIPTSALGSGGERGGVSSTYRALAAGAAAELVEALAVTNSVPNDNSVRAIVTGAPYTAYAEITQIQVDNIFDAQRRRARSMGRTTTSSAVSQ